MVSVVLVSVVVVSVVEVEVAVVMEKVVVEGLEMLGSDNGDLFPEGDSEDLFPRVSSCMSVDWKFLNDSFTSSKNRNCSLSRVTCRGCGRWRRKETLGYTGSAGVVGAAPRGGGNSHSRSGKSWTNCLGLSVAS